MLFSKSWIARYVDLPSDAEELGRRLTAAGHAVDGLEAHGDDHLLELDITTNRPDCMNHLGLAREAALLFGQPLRVPTDDPPRTAEKASDVARLVVEDHQRCPSYTGIVIRGVKVGPSPDWLVELLEAIGSRSINNIVDATNFVLWETGQPLHAFDLHKIGKGSDGLPEIRVRDARAGETLKTLDGEDRELDESILVIADPNEPIALGGIMGGFDSEVTEETVDVLLECAHFDPSTVRKGAKKLGMHTDASHRYERGADPKAPLWASRRCAALMVELAGGEVLEGHIEASELRQDWPPVVTIEVPRLERFGGIALGRERVVEILEGLGFGVAGDGDTLEVTAPSWRWYDFEGAHPQDVYEEVLRIHGFDAIPSTLPAVGEPDGHTPPSHQRRRHVQDVLAAAGFTEAINFAFLDRETDAAYPSFYGDREPMELANPLSDRYAVMRRSLLPNLVDSARFNQRRGAEAVRLFEVGHIFAADPGPEQRVEQETVALALGGQLGTPWEHQVSLDFFDLKGILEVLSEDLGRALVYRSAQLPRLVDGVSAEILDDQGVVVGVIGQLDLDDLPYPLLVAELALDALDESPQAALVDPPSRFPGIRVELTLTHAITTPFEELDAAIGGMTVEDLVDYSLMDRYQGQGVPEGAVNTTLTFLYNSTERSLTHDEVNERQQRLANDLEERFGFRPAES